MTLSHAAIAELADAGAAAGASALARQAARTRWALLGPALLILTFAAVGPLLIVLVYSFLTPGPYGGVVWSPSFEGWFRVLFQRDIFDELDAPVARVAQEEVPMPYNERLESAVLPNEDKILKAVYQVCYL